MQIHYGKHHQGYVNNLNAALAKHPALYTTSLEDLLRGLHTVPDDIRTAVRNNAGGHFNHSLFWTIMAPQASHGPTGALADAIGKVWGDVGRFKEAFSTAAATRFSSGWAWLAVHNGGLEVLSTANQDNPVMEGKTPILGLDVWEHAYYLKYQNRRADYITAWWNLVHWPEVARRYQAARTNR
jgi:Fe-Mn family superoxide dismutase